MDILNQQTYTGKIHKYLHLASRDKTKDDYFFVIFNSEIIARIFLLDRWYIWYENRCYRTPVKSFTEAINIIEKEVTLCTA